MTHRPFSGACFRHWFLAPNQSSGAENHDTLCQQMTSADKTKMDSDYENFIQKFIIFMLFYKLKKCFYHSTLSFIFVHKQTNSAIVC